MRTKHLSVLIHITIKVRLLPLSMFKPSSEKNTDRSKAVLLLRIIFVICVPRLSLLYCLICSLQPCDHLLGNG